MEGGSHMICYLASWGSPSLHRDWVTLIGCLAVVYVMKSFTPVAHNECQGKLADLGPLPSCRTHPGSLFLEGSSSVIIILVL